MGVDTDIEDPWFWEILKPLPGIEHVVEMANGLRNMKVEDRCDALHVLRGIQRILGDMHSNVWGDLMRNM
jgi:hypothetical protein